MDAYACIMCYRCQEVCPAYNTGKVLSPAALEINKRYFLNSTGRARSPAASQARRTADRVRHPRGGRVGLHGLRRVHRYLPGEQRADARHPGYPPRPGADGEQLPRASSRPPSAAWSAHANPWNVSPAERMKWAEGLDVPTIDREPRAGDPVVGGLRPGHRRPRPEDRPRLCRDPQRRRGQLRRAGREASSAPAIRPAAPATSSSSTSWRTANVEMLNEVKPEAHRHHLPALPAHPQERIPGLRRELHGHPPHPADQRAGGGRQAEAQSQMRQEQADLPRSVLPGPPQPDPRRRRARRCAQPGASLVEMPRHGMQSFCCGAGGAQMWKEEEHGSERVNANRFAEGSRPPAPRPWRWAARSA